MQLRLEHVVLVHGEIMSFRGCWEGFCTLRLGVCRVALESMDMIVNG
jgi:hypothetical protein